MRAQEFVGDDLTEVTGVLRRGANLIRNIGKDAQPEITMYSNPRYRGSMAHDSRGFDPKNIPVTQVDIRKLKPWEPLSKMRDNTSQITLYGMVNAIRSGKTLPPILVTPVMGGYRIVDGHHRYAAYLHTDAKTIPVRVVDPKKIRYSDEIVTDPPGVKVRENFADGRVRGKSRPGRVKRAGASCKGSVTDLRARAKKYGGERGKMYQWCANMKAGKKK